MDVVLRLRLLIWVILLSLWGVMLYQYLGQDDQETARMRKVVNPYSHMPPQPAPAPGALNRLGASEQLPPVEARTETADIQTEPESSLAMVLPPAPGGTDAAAHAGAARFPLAEVRAPDYIKGPAAPPREAVPPPEAAPASAAQPQIPEPVTREAPVPAGFFPSRTRHFTIYSEGAPASEDFLELLETLHGNLMLDLAPFSPWAQDDRVMIFLFKNQDTYRRITARPAWSGGASSVPKRKIYLYESSELHGILAHELCHIYYDSFFQGGKANPLWLSEGMATLIQVERGMAAPNWLRDNLDILEHGGGYELDELMRMSSTAGVSDAQVRLWYAQCYSLVRFLIRTQYRTAFYKFSRHLRDGRPTTEALYRAYGMPYNRLKALEYAWRYQISTNRLSRLHP